MAWTEGGRRRRRGQHGPGRITRCPWPGVAGIRGREDSSSNRVAGGTTTSQTTAATPQRTPTPGIVSAGAYPIIHSGRSTTEVCVGGRTEPGPEKEDGEGEGIDAVAVLFNN